MTTAAADYLGMSDEDFLKVNAPAATAPVEAAAVVEKSEEEKAAEAAALAAQEAESKAAEDAAAKLDEDQNKGEEDKDTPAPGSEAKPEDDANKAEKTEEEKAAEAAAALAAKAEADKGKTPEQISAEAAAAAERAKNSPEAKGPEAKTEEAPKVVDHKAFYDSLIGTPIKANGKTITLKSPEEVLRMVQMGAGYGRKIQDLQPHLKVLRMLEKNELLDESKLSLLIDVNNKNPDAIKKIIKDSGIDPLDINTGDNVDYKPVNHSVSDQEVAFQDALSDIQSHEGGQDTLKEINQKWDAESKSALWQEPSLLGVIQSQRDNGIYAKIAEEIDRQKLLGTIPNSTPFLKAYQLVGNQMFPAPAQATQSQTQPGVTQQPQVLATRTEAPKAQVKNSEQAAAAAAPKSSSTRKPAPVNPLAMADDDFMKQFEGRL